MTIFGKQGLMGELGRGFALLNLQWFGYFGYFYLLLFIYPAYILYKNATLTAARLKNIFATLLLVLGVLLLQYIIAQKGELGGLIIRKLVPLFGYFGVWILVIICVLLGLALLFPKQMGFIKNKIIFYTNKLFVYLKQNFIQAYIYVKPNVLNVLKALQSNIIKSLYYLSYTESKNNAFKQTPPRGVIPQNFRSNTVALDSHSYLSNTHNNPQPPLEAPSPFDENKVLKTSIDQDFKRQQQIQEEKKYKKMVRFVKDGEQGELLDINISETLERLKKHQKPVSDKSPQLQYINLDSASTTSKSTPESTPTLESSSALDSIDSGHIESSPLQAPTQAMDSAPLQKVSAQDSPSPSQSSKVQILKELESTNKILQNLDKGTLEKPKDYILPSTTLLAPPPSQKVHFEEDEIDTKIQNLLAKLKVFKIDGDVSRIYSGPVVTTFEFRPAPNIKVSRILGLSDDLAMALCANSIRIQAPIPGKDVVGIEVPNTESQTIYLREILESEVFTSSASPLALGLGKDIVGNPFVTDLKKLPHLLIAGTTGSGKSVGVNAMILSLLYRNSPENLKLIMIDPKKVEFSLYEEIPHLLTPIITDAKKAIIALGNVAKEMERRYEIMKEAKTKTIDNYNAKAKEEHKEILPFIVVIIDELADLMMTGGKDVEGSIIRIAQMGRAAGLHLIVATQRPSVDVVTGLIKTNLPAKIAFKVGSRMDSRVILDTEGAQNLLGRGDMLFTLGGGNNLLRLHAPWTSEEEIEEIVQFIREQRSAQYDSSFLADNTTRELESSFDSNNDDMLLEAKRIMLMDGKTSISNLQRRLGIGYNKAASIVEELEKQGFLSTPNAKGIREIVG